MGQNALRCEFVPDYQKGTILHEVLKAKGCFSVSVFRPPSSSVTMSVGV